MEGKKVLRTIRLENLLSYGPASGELELEPLNVLIGPNSSGKSNLIEVIALLAAAPRDLQRPIREGGGVWEYLWKGEQGSPVATVDATLHYPEGPMALRYRLSFTESSRRFLLVDEAIENERAQGSNSKPYFYYAYQKGHPALNVMTTSGGAQARTERRLQREDVSPEQSILSQRRDPDAFPELTYVASELERVRFYREWNLGRYTAPRMPQRTDLPDDVLLEDASNLGLVINHLHNTPAVKRVFMERLRAFYSGIEEVTTRIQGGTVQVYFHEAGLRHPVPATRLSDGTLRYVCLLAILCHPEPPPVVCIEEPELGLHPDAIPTVADLLVEASRRTQLFVTTHSDVLVSALSDYPESVVVCERDDAGTRLRRLEAAPLGEWLERYRLGELWQMGEIGGNPR